MSVPVASEFWHGIVRSRLTATGNAALPQFVPMDSHAIEALEEEERAMRRAICTVRVERNALLPIHGLPSEVLSYVFALCAADPPSYHTNWLSLGWVVVTHVCRRWRDTALGCAGLWADVSLGKGEQWAGEMLRRAQVVPVRVDTGEKVTGTACQLVAAHLHHTKELSLGEMALVEPPPGARLLSADNPAPLLTTLNISAFSGTPPLGQLGSCAPSLRRLTVQTSAPNLPWTSHLLKNLTMLNVSGSVWHLPTLSMNDVLSALRRMPGLEMLHLVGCLPRPEQAQDTIVLSRLTDVKLGGQMQSCISLLCGIKAPNCSTTCFDLFCSSAIVESIVDAIKALSAWLKTNWRVSPMALRFSDNADDQMQVEAWATSFGDFSARRLGHMYKQEADVLITFLWIEGEPPEVDRPGLALACYGALESPQLEQLAVQMNEWDCETWEDLVGSHAGLQRISADKEAADGLITALGGADDNETPHFPSLYSIELCGVKFFQAEWHLRGDGHPVRSHLTFHSNLQEWLQTRADRGYPLGKLTLRDAIVHANYLTELGEVQGLSVDDAACTVSHATIFEPLPQ
ncbi:hypothetical protein FA95DRAFT_1562499 [Auriscalpium vulgare]|uniref:Uncharacterized protein n=1 Tax=Auriscalpium vulgare TaxID=40419 RepID=A0ACB8RKM2_9AGAM|nr:hypothetical protein FA95DRAFT_1562499 [Auriscalpium vulgare]